MDHNINEGNADKNLLTSLKVLLAEDEELARNELSIFLKRRVGKLYTASNGQEALAVFQINKPDLIITDLKMPIMGGIELVENIRKAGSKCPVIVVTALTDSDTILKAVDLGIIKYAVKPLDTDELVRLMNTLAADILKLELGETVIDGKYILQREEKIEIEKKLKSEIANFLKTYTGKGPRDVNVFIKGDKIEVKANGVLTMIETNLVKARRNFGLVDYNRKVFYQETISVLEQKISDTISGKVRLQSVLSESERDVDELIFKIL